VSFTSKRGLHRHDWNVRYGPEADIAAGTALWPFRSLYRFNGEILPPIEDLGAKTVMCEEHSGLTHGF
jgi:hypothetical protein